MDDIFYWFYVSFGFFMYALIYWRKRRHKRVMDAIKRVRAHIVVVPIVREKVNWNKEGF